MFLCFMYGRGMGQPQHIYPKFICWGVWLKGLKMLTNISTVCTHGTLSGSIKILCDHFLCNVIF